ncbi:BTB/POZ domain-containing protein At1g04390 [Euphorbia peplus]|nr:BTB/POZ domain-containing protein At1g04390 [Euphorbia peplus]
MRSSKQLGTENRGISGHVYKLHQRLHHALSLGSRFYDGNEFKWQCSDIEIQRHVVRSIASFLDCVSADIVYHPLVKDSVADMVWALVWILQNRSKAIVNMATDEVVKLINVLPNILLQPYFLDLCRPLSSLLSSHQVESISCAPALNMILSHLSARREKQTWDILVETKTVSHIVSGMKKTSAAAMPNESFKEMANLLSTILHRWPQSRYPVWNDAMLLEALEVMRVKPDFSVKVAVLKLYCALALCSNGANKLLENGEALLQMMALCMGRSYPLSVRIEGFRLAQCLARNKQGCLKMMNLCCEPIVKATIDGMSGWTINSGKIASEDVTLLVEACRLSMISRWAGPHHDFLWKQRIDMVLVNILLNDFHDRPSHYFSDLEEQISVARERLKANVFLSLQAYVWNLLAWLATHCREDLSADHELKLDILITCACISFEDSIRRGRQICQDDESDIARSESVSRAVLMLIYSPSKYIASKARAILCELLKSTNKEMLKHLLHVLHIRTPKDNVGMLNFLQISVNLMALVCCSGLSEHQSQIVKSGGINTFMGLIKWCLSNDIRGYAPHLHTIFSDKTCCWVYKEDWENDSILMLYSLWGLFELLRSRQISSISEVFTGSAEYTEAQFVSTLQEICSGTSSPGTKWYAALILNYFGIYGFPSKLGRCIGKAFNMNEYADMQLNLSNEDSLSVHGVVLAVRCPALLPPPELPHSDKSYDGSSIGYNTERTARKFHKEIRISSHVDSQALTKLLEFVYMGFLNACEELVKKVRILAKRCRLEPLLMLLDGRHPKWGTCFPRYDLSVVLAAPTHHFSDIILEAKGIEPMHWACGACSQLVPHMHAHKVVLWSRCDYLRALFESGMSESNSQIIKVPVSWEAMTKLVQWCYSDDLPSPPTGCLWDNLDNREKLYELQPYLELCWLAEFWFLEDVCEISYGIIVSCLDSAKELSIKVIKIAADFSLWKLVEVTANHLAPLYRQLCQSGDLDALDEEVVEMIRAASVRLSQEK